MSIMPSDDDVEAAGQCPPGAPARQCPPRASLTPAPADADPRLTRISKFLVIILRHNAIKVGLRMGTARWVKVADLLNLRRLQGATVDDIRRLVGTETNRRFELRMVEQSVLTRAIQYHSISHLRDDLA